MKRFFTIVSMLFVFVMVGLVAADTASAAGRGRRGRTSCDCAPTCAAEPGCAANACAAEPACGAAEACASEPACCAAASNCCEPRRRGRARGGLFSRRSKESCGESCTSLLRRARLRCRARLRRRAVLQRRLIWPALLSTRE